ncbi:MAG: phytanoyl-CoA dioxygenase family protein [Alphaproteobacteria bacterium]|nr:phytanoyl-CoA dioxygenase family protein [Alphaproteobacteria bacterium]
MSLSPDQIEHYWQEGYVTGLRALSEEEAGAFLAELEEIEAREVEARGGRWHPRDYRPWEQEDHPLVDWLDRLARHPAVLDHVASLLGPDILVRNCDVFIKEPGVRRGIGWHRDTAVTGEDADRLLTVWLGLTDADDAKGALRFSARSHRQDIPGGPKDRFTLTLTKEAATHLDPERTVHNTLRPGMMSMHHFATVHSSGPNTTTSRRVAFVGRYMSPAISTDTAESGQATLVRGQDTHRHFALKPRFPMTWTS